MEHLEEKLANFDYWASNNPNQFSITAYDLKFCQTRITNKQSCHKSLSADIETLQEAYPDDKDMTKSLSRMRRKLSSIANDKQNVGFWNTTAKQLYEEQLKKSIIEARFHNTTKEAVDKTAREVFDLDGEKGESTNKRKLGLRSNDKSDNKKQKMHIKVDFSTLSEIDGVMIGDGDNPSVGTVIKRKAIELCNAGTPTTSRQYKIMTNGLSSILDLNDITETSQKSLFKSADWDHLMKMYSAKYSITLVLLPDIITSTWKIINALINKSRDINVGLKYLYQIFPKHVSKPHFFLLKICEHMLELMKTRGDMLLKNDDHSENSYLTFVWSRFFDLLFPNNGIIKIKTGETIFYKGTENKKQLYGGSSKTIGFKIDVRLLIKHNNMDVDLCSLEIAKNDGDSKIIDDQGKLNREAKDILDNLITIIPESQSEISAGWTIQIGGASCFISAIHLDANGLYVVVPKYQFTLPSSFSEFDKFLDILSKLLTFRQSMYSIADAVRGTLSKKYSVATAFGRAAANTNIDPRIHWMRDSYYTPPKNAAPVIPSYLFGLAPPTSSIIGRLLSVSHEDKQVNTAYKSCKFDENGWTFSDNHWYNSITKKRTTSSPYEESDGEGNDNPNGSVSNSNNQTSDMATPASSMVAQSNRATPSSASDFGLFWRRMESESYEKDGYAISCIDSIEDYLSRSTSNKEKLTAETVDNVSQTIQGYLLLENVQTSEQINSKLSSLKHLIKCWKLLIPDN